MLLISRKVLRWKVSKFLKKSGFISENLDKDLDNTDLKNGIMVEELVICDQFICKMNRFFQ